MRRGDLTVAILALKAASVIRAVLGQPLHGVSAFVQHYEIAMPGEMKACFRTGRGRYLEAILCRDTIPGRGIKDIRLAADRAICSARSEEQRMIEQRICRRDIATAAATDGIDAERFPAWLPAVDLSEPRYLPASASAKRIPDRLGSEPWAMAPPHRQVLAYCVAATRRRGYRLPPGSGVAYGRGVQAYCQTFSLRWAGPFHTSV